MSIKNYRQTHRRFDVPPIYPPQKFCQIIVMSHIEALGWTLIRRWNRDRRSPRGRTCHRTLFEATPPTVPTPGAEPPPRRRPVPERHQRRDLCLYDTETHKSEGFRCWRVILARVCRADRMRAEGHGVGWEGKVVGAGGDGLFLLRREEDPLSAVGSDKRGGRAPLPDAGRLAPLAPGGLACASFSPIVLPRREVAPAVEVTLPVRLFGHARPAEPRTKEPEGAAGWEGGRRRNGVGTTRSSPRSGTSARSSGGPPRGAPRSPEPGAGPRGSNRLGDGVAPASPCSGARASSPRSSGAARAPADPSPAARPGPLPPVSACLQTIPPTRPWLASPSSSPPVDRPSARVWQTASVRSAPGPWRAPSAPAVQSQR